MMLRRLLATSALAWLLGCSHSQLVPKPTAAPPTPKPASKDDSGPKPPAMPNLATAASAGETAAPTPSPADDDPLLALRSLGDALAEQAPEGGGSIRAKPEVDTSRAQMLAQPENLLAVVGEIQRGRFPLTAVKVRVLRPAQAGAGSRLQPGDELVLLPLLKLVGDTPDLSDQATVRNQGAYYLKVGDKVRVCLGETSGKAIFATRIERG